jgi:membrane protease YdiL (CAAX protease family)
MYNKTFFQTPKGPNKWYNYIFLYFLIGLLAALLSLPVYFLKSADGTYQKYLKDLLPSALMFFSLFWVFKSLHQRSALTLINANKIRWKRIFWAMGCFGGITLFFELVNYLYKPSLYQFSFNQTTFFQFMVISLVLIPFQAAAEELLMRGYYLQGIAWATKKPWLAVIITSVFFGLLHLANPEIKAFGLPFIFGYIFMGIAAGIMTIMDDGTELAIGLHIVNNLYAAIIVGFSSSALQTNTLFFIKYYNPIFWSIVATISLLLFLAISHKKYGWGSHKLLFKRLDA